MEVIAILFKENNGLSKRNKPFTTAIQGGKKPSRGRYTSCEPQTLNLFSGEATLQTTDLG